MIRTKIFMVGYFLPSWIAALMMWGDDRTSSGFEAAPPWFYYGKFFVQILAILVLFMPLQLRRQPSLIGCGVAVGVIVSTFFARPVLEAEFVLLNSSIQIAVLAIFLAFAQPSAKLDQSHLRLLFYLFMIGFLLQIMLLLGFGRTPSHSITDVFVRFNGITNDSLSAGLILPLLVPWAIRTRYPLSKSSTLIVSAILTGSLFGAVSVPAAALIYAMYCRLYRLAATLVAGAVGGVIFFYSIFSALIDLKFMSIMTHLRFFLNLSGVEYDQPRTSCAEEFCESFIEGGLTLSPIYMILVYAMLLSFIIPLFRSDRTEAKQPVIPDTLRVYGLTLIAGSFVHPIPLIPFAVPLFLILASLYLGDRATTRAKTSASRSIEPLWVGQTHNRAVSNRR